jgi:AraC family transcriptional regulator
MPSESRQDPVNKALWFIESHFAEPVDLDGVAAAAGVSRYHLTRAFHAALGQPIVRYLRGRRLTEAARSLANGAPDILSIALESGYGSHEAFTRAFREQFGTTPEAVREQRHTHTLNLTEAIEMDKSSTVQLNPPRIVEGKAMLIAGLNARNGCANRANIPSQWQSFAPRIGHIPGQVSRVAYGVLHNGDEEGNQDYLCGVEVHDFSKLSADLDRLRVPPQKYAVFQHAGHISGIGSTWNTVWRQALPKSGLEVVDAPAFERYGEDFDGRAGTGGVELWIPVR